MTSKIYKAWINDLYDCAYYLDEHGQLQRHEFLALHSERPDPDQMYLNGAFCMPKPEPWVFDTTDWPQGVHVTHISSWKGERCVAVSGLGYPVTTNGCCVITIDFGRGGGGDLFEPVPIPARLQGA